MRDAPRDLVHLTVLQETELKDPARLLVSQPRERLEEALSELWVKVESMGYERFKAEVAPYLPLETAAAITEDAYSEMQVSVATNVDKWLADAIELQEKTEAAGPPNKKSGAK